MENQDYVEPVEQNEVANIQAADMPQDAQPNEHNDAQKGIINALQKERRKRHEAEMEIKFLKEHVTKQTQPIDETQYESATKAEVSNATKSAEITVTRKVLEHLWKRENPEKWEKVDRDLEDFLIMRPNLAPAIEASANRYEEAWALMNAFSPKQKQQMASKPKSDAPGSPSSVPKAAAMEQAVNLMTMSDNEFNAWRQQQRKRR
tara:strand:+ start:2672 stop:3286 length:615 start_codon:yes stop_codon:yes gene_type:complete